MWDDVAHMQALDREVAHLRTLLQPSDTGHIHTTIGVLMNRIHEIANTLDLESSGQYIDVEGAMRIAGGEV
jgi:hypothetical protein